MKAEPKASEASLWESALGFWRLLHPLPSLLTVAAAGAFILLVDHGLPPLGRFLWAMLIETAMQFSISAFNDYFDREIDTGRPEKPVAQGTIPPGVAALAGLILGLLALVPAIPLGGWVFALTAIGLGGGLLYDAGLKYTALSWLPFAVAFPTLPLWAWAVAHPDSQFPLYLLWVVPVGAVLAAGIHLADTIPDLASDHAAGVRGAAHRLGTARSVILCWSAFGAALLLTMALWPYLDYRAGWYVLGAAVGVAFVLASGIAYAKSRRWSKATSILVEVGSLALAIGWLGAIFS